MPRIVLSGFAFLFLAGIAFGLEAKRASDVDATPVGKLDEKSDAELKKMCDYLSGLKSFAFEAEDCNDVIQENGQKLQFSTHLTAQIVRPSHVWSKRQGDAANRETYFDGVKKTLTVFDPVQNAYTTTDVPATIDELCNHIYEKFGAAAVPPLADFMLSDPYHAFTQHVQNGSYVGLHHIDGRECHHLAFRGEAIDWQLWIDAEGDPVPRRMVITFKREDDSPQYMTRITNWKVNPKVEDGRFTFHPPADAKPIEAATP